MIVRIAPIDENGGSTGLAPIQVSNITTTMNLQYTALPVGLNFLLILFSLKHRTKNTKIAATIATTPPSLEGIDRKIA